MVGNKSKEITFKAVKMIPCEHLQRKEWVRMMPGRDQIKEYEGEGKRQEESP